MNYQLIQKQKKGKNFGNGMQWVVLLFVFFLSLPLLGVVRTYTDNGNGTIKDNGTSLVWQKCSAGQTNDAFCSGTVSAMNWQSALAYCEMLSLGGREDWRLPNLKELLSLVDYTKYNPAIDGTKFINTPISAWYWSSSHGSSTHVMLIDNLDGATQGWEITGNYQVRCVAGGLN
ncbi:MAG TPA: hypothetical protein DHW82_13910 [Spirochaetia bacterium]|nr:hypothetical protein [Spirochaetia bacterium]